MIFKDKKIQSVGMYVPPRILTNGDMSKMCDTSHQWIHNNLGIHQRHIADDESVTYMGFMAASRALLLGNISKEEIGAVIVSCSSPSHFAPSVSCQIINMFNIQVPAFDINAVCSGFVYALELGCHMINSGAYDKVLIVATEKYSSITDYTSRDSVYFGDGAGAVVLSRGKGRITTKIFANGLSDDAFISTSGGKYTIKGRKVLDAGLELLPGAIKSTLGEINMPLGGIRYIVPHQAGIVLLRRLMQEIGFPPERCIMIMDRYANLASASIPVALFESREINILSYPIMLMAIGSGWTWGIAVVEP